MSEYSITVQLQVLLDRFNEGEVAAKEQLIEIAYQRLLTVARRLLNGFPAVRIDEETAGVLSDAYPSLSKSIEELKPRSVGQFMALASLEIRRSLLDRMRKLRGRGKVARRRPTSLSAGKDAETTAPADIDVPDTDGQNDRSSLAMDMLDAIDTLPEDEREVVDLLYFHGLTQIEVAEVVGVSKDTIKRRWSRARIRLAEYLAEFAEPVD
ncbi:MAG TPA: sigma-70 family RNA polymerase sigma factor [Pirellulaceae bacterium]|nr:sigma-70 family RNA polymerase sigma factor [Pirellulaceae bacterium]HMO93940.1 sigma-70 family RNA polymerase sigma factor [Pirellulaceae bacterium]HMP69749.1 sigma-70 family RNA polymerase sigma factor [Pirellulaceae bacterium]